MNAPSITVNDKNHPSNKAITGNMPTEFGMHISQTSIL
jgi:hypothetical protein